ncbi:MAG TPA: PASTA domain-containing protein [Fimbriimonadaceae bacterium]|nr:PASTA domain-containing protein [Fimbriimonadaceae bacterium]HRJ95829.1 PASTA domain-containing protein [Fimbriimonadaceae bacterium]
MIGTIFRIRYELIEQIDDGPLFSGYKARDRVAGREVCVRVLKRPFADEPGFVERLRDVVKRSSVIQHPGLERLIDLDDHEGTPFLVSELPAGLPLEERIRKLAPFSPAVAVGLAMTIGQALDAVHGAGMVHGDLSGRNINLTPDGKTKLALTGLWETYSASRTAGAAVLPGMAPYLAPEITGGEMPTPASDVYALGVILFELLAGRRPYSGDTSVSVALKHATAPVPSVRAFNPGVPAVLDEIVRKALAKNPADRYPNAKALMADLRAVQDALRFGKSLAWPIKDSGEEPSPVAPSVIQTADPEVKPAPLRNPKTRDREVNDSVPKWLLALVYIAVCALVILVSGWVYWNFTKPKLVRVPNIVGLSLTDAQKQLESAGLRLKVGRRLSSEKQPADEVLATQPPSGAEKRVGGDVLVDVSTGSRFVDVPDLRGRTLDEAKAMLANVNLQMDENVRKARNRNIQEGRIITQVPDPRSKVERSTRIRVTISGREEDRAERPPTEGDLGTYSFHLRFTVPDAEEPIRIKIIMTDGKGSKTIFDEDRSAGEQVEIEEEGAGPEATFRIFFDGELVNQVTKRADEE